MPTQGNARRAVRLEDELWERFGAVADPDRSTVVRAFIAWYVREPGAKLPRRPEPIEAH